MKYWAFLMAKFAAVVAIWWGLERVAGFVIGRNSNPFMRALVNTTGSMVLTLILIGLLYVVIWDQRYRCRTCLRRLRMPVAAGSWPNMLLKGQPRMEYICVYGHGTLKMPEVDLTGAKRPDWEPHDDDIWKELESLGGKR